MIRTAAAWTVLRTTVGRLVLVLLRPRVFEPYRIACPTISQTMLQAGDRRFFRGDLPRYRAGGESCSGRCHGSDYW
jgi:hypothetical protein